jgi:putative ABC transport system permease protein
MLSVLSVLKIAIKRLWHNLGLTLSALVGIVCVLTIIVGVPIFSHTVSGELLRQQLSERAAETGRSLFGVHIHTLQVESIILDVDTCKAMGEYIAAKATNLMDLPIAHTVTEIYSPRMGMTPVSVERYSEPGQPLTGVSFLSLDKLPEHAEVREGEWPASNPLTSGAIQVAIHRSLAEEMGLELGERYRLGDTLEIEISGIWQENSKYDPFWFKDPKVAYSHTLWIPEIVYRQRIETALSDAVGYVAWYIVVDERDLSFQQAERYARAITRLDNDLNSQVPDIKMDYSPLRELIAYQERARSLTTLLYSVGAPMAVLALFFILLTSHIAVQQREQEVAAIRSRGTSRLQVVVLNLMESLIIVALALPLSLYSGWYAADVMSNSLSFLEFTTRPPLPLTYDGLSPMLVGGVIAVLVGARLIPAWGISQHTIVRMKQKRGRRLTKPLWQRLYLDFFLLLPGVYAYLVLGGWTKPTGILQRFFGQTGAENVGDALKQAAGPLTGLGVTAEPYRDPLLFVAPAVFAMATCMVLMRVVPLVARALAVVAERLPGAWAYLALQQIARRPQDHMSALLLITISLSLAIFSASAARTLDQWLSDTIHYSTGADLAVRESIPESPLETLALLSMGGGDLEDMSSTPSTTEDTSFGLTSADLDIEDSMWYPDLQQHLKLPGVIHATRVGKYQGRFSSGRSETPCWILGIDRLELPQVAFFRDDFASVSLGALMNALGAEPMGVLIPGQLAVEQGFSVGDRLSVVVDVMDLTYVRDLVVVGTYDYFPTVYPYEMPTLIVNLEQIFGNPDAVIGYDVWLELAKDTDIPSLIDEIRKTMAVIVQIRGNAPAAIQRGQDQVERVGLFGVLNIGFLTAGLMPGIGFVLYSYASLRQRFIQLGILQAIGLRVSQLVGYLISEQLLLMGIAILGGAAVGLGTSKLFIPFLQTGVSSEAQIPPFKVLIGWTEAGWLSLGFGIVLFLTMIGTIVYLVRLKVFQVVKLGETL